MKTVSPYKIRLVTSGTKINDKELIIPVGNTFDGTGQNELIEDYVTVLADDAINPIVDYEEMRYTPIVDSGGTKTDKMDFEFQFYGTPTWEDYKKVVKSGADIKFDELWGGTDGQIITYPTPNSFHYTNIDGKITWSLSDATLVIVVFSTQIPVTTMNGVLKADEILGQYYVNNTNVYPGGGIGNTVSNQGSFQGTSGSYTVDIVQTVKTNGDAYIASTTGGLVNTTYWKRSISISGVFYVSNLNPSDTLRIDLRTGGYPSNANKVYCEAEGYDFTYEGNSSENIQYSTEYSAAPIPGLYIDNDFKGYTQSFFRLDFYDSVLEGAQNLLFTDILTVSEGYQSKAEFNTTIDKQNYFLYWLKNDPIIQENGYRDVWMKANFFNSAIGQIQQFSNVSGNQNLYSAPTIDEYQTLLKYTKIRLYENYTYMVCQRKIAMGWGVQGGSTPITDSDSQGTSSIILKLLRIRA